MTLVTLQDLKKAGGLLSESPVVGTQVGHLLEAKAMDETAWLGLLIKGSAAGFPEVGEAEDREFLYNLIMALLVSVKGQNPALLTDFLKSLAQSSTTYLEAEQCLSRLQRLLTLFPAGSTEQKLVFKTLVLVPVDGKDLGALLDPLLPHLSELVSKFSIDGQKELLLFLVEKLSASRPIPAYEFHLAYVMLLDLNDKDAQIQAKKALIKGLSLESVFNFETLLALEPVAALKGKDIAVELASLFLSGNVASFKDFIKKHPSFCIHQDKLTEKFKIMALSSLAAHNVNSFLSFASIAKAIDVPASEVEQWIIHGVRSSLIEARMDQQNECVFIVRATSLVFGKAEWETLAVRIEAVKSQLKQIQSALHPSAPSSSLSL